MTYKCLLCGFDTPLDDVIAPPSNGRCVCLRCYLRETDHREHLSAWWVREFEAALAQ